MVNIYTEYERLRGILTKVVIDNAVFIRSEEQPDIPADPKVLVRPVASLELSPRQETLTLELEPPKQGVKRCTGCGQLKTFGYFYVVNGKPSSRCKVCVRKQSREHYKKVRDSTPKVHRNIIHVQNLKPEIGFIDATQPNALPLVDSGSVLETEYDKKIRNWGKFKEGTG